LASKELGYPSNSFYERNTLNREQYSQFEIDFKYGVINDFMNANLSQHPGDKSQPVLFYLKVPKGERMGYLKDDQIFINRDKGFEVKDTRIITEEGRELIKVTAKLVRVSDIIREIKKIESRMNDKFNAKTNLKVNAVKLKVDGFYSSRVTRRSETLFDQLISSIP